MPSYFTLSALVLVFLYSTELVSAELQTQLYEVHSSSWLADSAELVRQFDFSFFLKQGTDEEVLRCGVLAAKHLLVDQLLVLVPRNAMDNFPRCFIARRGANPCRRLTPPRYPQSPCCIRVFVTSLDGCWISVQRRVDNSTSFYRNWSDYANGFGQGPHSNHWLGLRTIHSLTANTYRKISFRMRLWNDTEYAANYATFSIANETEKFRISISGFHSNNHPAIGDSMNIHNGMMFISLDSDNDASATLNCCQIYYGGWWYNDCHNVNPNGLYFNLPLALNTSAMEPNLGKGINWKHSFGYFYSMKEFEILVY